MQSHHIRSIDWKLVLFAGLPVLCAGLAGGMFTGPAIPGWYAGLTKPWFSPPNWVFGPVWTVLYVMMAYAFYRVLKLPENTQGRSLAMVCFVGQLILNAAWSAAFFGLRSPAGGLIVILPLLGLIVISIALFRPLDRTASALLMPYAAWVSFAMLLNAAFWQLN
ncbi:MAG: TspO/MBR family protein [Bosea sp. (in: a-proteobacteria)]